MKNYLTIIFLLLSIGISGDLSAQIDFKTLRSGDLLFVSDTSGMGLAIQQSTGNYTHVAIVERDGDSLFIIDATRKRGVARRPIEKNFAYKMPTVAYRLNVPFDPDAVIARAKSFIGQPYDDSFLPDNGMMYCSELVYEAYLDANGKHLFHSQPMNFRDKRGKMPKYWKKHFRELGISIPEGVEGTNPSDLSKSPLLIKVQ